MKSASSNDRDGLVDNGEKANMDIEVGTIGVGKEKSHKTIIRSHRCSHHMQLFTFSVLLLLLFVFLGLWVKQKIDAESSSCFEPQCIQLASEVIRRIDLTLNPCDNFQRFACNGLQRKKNEPTCAKHVPVLSGLAVQLHRYMKELFENKSCTDDSMELSLAKKFYQSCTSVRDPNKRIYELIYNQLRKEFGGWILLPPSSNGSRTDGGKFLTTPYFNLTQLYLSLLKNFDDNPFVGIHVTSKKEIQIVLLEVIGDISPSKESNSSVTEVYKMMLKNMEQLASLIGVLENSTQEHANVLDLVMRMKSEEKSPANITEEGELPPLKLEDLQNLCPIFDWKSVLQEIFSQVNYIIKDEENIKIKKPQELAKRCKLIEEYSKTNEGIRTLHNAVVWNLLYKIDSFLPSGIQNVSKWTMKDTSPYWEYCLDHIPDIFHGVVLQQFVKDNFNIATKDSVLMLVNEIKETLKEQLNAVSWMVEEDKLKVIEKLRRISAHIGHPEEFIDNTLKDQFMKLKDQINNESYLENCFSCQRAWVSLLLTEINRKDQICCRGYLSVNAYYDPRENSIIFPATFIQAPIYDVKQPEAFNYGRLGIVIGHELAHAFDNIGINHDASASLKKWLSNETLQAFEKHSSCLVDQYSNYRIDNISINGTLTLGENIADNVGFRTAYHTFEKFLNIKRDITLPGLSFTSEQLFFIAAAQLDCDDDPIYHFNDVHTNSELRLNGFLHNFEAFGKAFNCPVGSPMNPETKCIIF